MNEWRCPTFAFIFYSFFKKLSVAKFAKFAMIAKWVKNLVRI